VTIEVSRSDLAELLARAPHEGGAWERLADQMLSTSRAAPLDLENRYPDIPVPVPVRNVIGDVLTRAVRSELEYWAPFRRGGVTPPRATKCHRTAAGIMVHVKPDCRC